MRRRMLVLVLCAIGLGATALPRVARATPPNYLGGQFRYWVFSDHNDLRDVLAYWVPGPFHVQLEYWDFLDPNTRDQFRPEVGLHLRDSNHSVYTVQWRHERQDDRLTVGTDQVLSDHVVGRVEGSAIAGSGGTVWVYDAGGDYYWGWYNFASATLIHDGREPNLWILPMRVRLANENDDWLQFTLSPATQHSIGWAIDVKQHGVRLGVERNSRYDFTNVDNLIFTIGYERKLGPQP